MNTNVQVKCPHCDHTQTKQVDTSKGSDKKPKLIGAYHCDSCIKEFVIYIRIALECKTKALPNEFDTPLPQVQDAE